MICPKCGNSLDLFADKCLSCGKSFKGMSLAERQKLQKRHPPKRRVHHKRTPKRPSNPNATKTRIEYNNGIACKEGMSYTGKRLRKGSFKKRPNNEGTRNSIGTYGLGQYPY